MKTSNVAMCFKQTYKLRFIYGIESLSMRTAISVFDKEASNNIVNSTLPHPQQTDCIKRGKISHPRTEPQKPLHMNGKILLYDHPGDLCVRECFGIVRSVANDMLHGTFFVDHFIRELFPTKYKAAAWQSHPAAILSAMQRNQRTCLSTSPVDAPLG